MATEQNTCEWCGGFMTRREQRKHNGFLFHGVCKASAIERATADSARRKVAALAQDEGNA